MNKDNGAKGVVRAKGTGLASNTTRLSLAASVAVLVVGVACSLFAASRIQSGLRASDTTKFERLAERLKTETERRLKSYAYGLRGARGTFVVSKVVERSEFRAYVASRDLPNEFPGLLGFGFIERVQRNELDEFIAAQRADGAPDFAIHTLADTEGSSESPELYVTKLFEPTEHTHVSLGFDFATEPVRREALERAMLTGEATLTGKIRLVQDEHSRLGYLFFLPVFRNGMLPCTPEERRRDLLGWVNAPLVIEEALAGLTGAAEGRLSVEIYDGRETTSGTLLYNDNGSANAVQRSQGEVAAATRPFHQLHVITVGGREWSMWLGSTQVFDAEQDHTTPLFIAASGTLISVLLAVALWGMGSSRVRTLMLARAMTANLASAKNRAESALRETEALRSTLDKHAIVSVADNSGNITAINDRFCRISGYQREELIGQDHRILNSGHHPKCFWVEMWRTITSGQAWHGEVCNRAKDGSLYWVDSIIAPFNGADGRIEKYVSIRSDITDRKRAEHELQERTLIAALEVDIANALTRGGTLAETLQLCTEAVSHHLNTAFTRIWTLNDRENMLELQASAGMYTHLHGPHGRVPVGKFKIGLIAEERKPHLSNQVVGDPRVSDQAWAKREGMVAFAGYPLLVDNRLVGVIATFARHRLTDVILKSLSSISNNIAGGIERKWAEKLLTETKERTKLVIDTAFDAVVAMDVSGLVTDWNAQAEATFGWKREEAVGRPMHELIIPERLRELHWAGLARYLSTGESRVTGRRIEVPAIRKDGVEITVELAITPLRSGAGPSAEIWFSAFLRDVTERRLADGELLRSKHRALVLYEVGAASSQAGSVAEIIALCLRAICTETGWHVGHALEVNPDGALISTRLWHFAEREEVQDAGTTPNTNDSGYEEFRAVSERFHFASGVGLPGRVLKTGKPQWIADIHENPNFPRAEMCKSLNLHGAFAFPVSVAGHVAAVLEFFHLDRVEPDPDLLLLVQTLSREIGGVIERMRMTESLQESIKRFQTVSQATNDVAWDWDLVKETLWWNEGFAAMFGYSAGEFGTGLESWTARIHPEDLSRVTDSIHAVVDGIGQLWSAEYRFLRHDGEFADIFDRGFVIRDDAGKGIRMIGAMQDITERKRVERSLHESEERFRSSFELGLIGMAITSEDQRFTQVNSKMCEILGYEKSELLQKTWSELTHKDDLAEDFASFSGLLAGEFDDYSMNKRFIRSDGQVVHSIISVKCHRRIDGSVAYFVAGMEDVTERTRAEMALHESEQRFRTIADTIPQLVWTADPTGYSDYCNARWHEYSGLSVEDTLGSGWATVLHPDDVSKVATSWAESVRSGAPFSTECRLRRGSDGAYRWFVIRGVAVRDTGGVIVQWIGACTDIDDQKRALVTEAARLEAEAANRAKSEFLATMSHELRTPLNGVIGMTELLLGTNLDAQQRRFALLAKSSGDGLLSLINDILDFSKIEAGKLELEKIDFDLRYAVESVMAPFVPRAETKHLNLISELHVDVAPLVRGDPGRLQQILINLVSNAIKFTEVGEVAVLATLEKRDERSEVVRFTVEDTGIGIPQNRLNRLFASFSQVDASTTRKYGGTGLGLAICKRLVELMDGQIGAESEEGKGSKFWFTIPLQLHVLSGSHAQTIVDQALPKGTNPNYKTASKNTRILLAEDHPISQEVAATMLRQAGYHCDAVANGREALEAVKQGDYDLVLMDCQMPEMDGFTATRAIRDAEKSGQFIHKGAGRLPIVALTANAIKGDRERCLEAGMDDYLSKPLNPNRLISLVDACVGSHGQERVEASRAQLDKCPDQVPRPSSAFDMDRILRQWGNDKPFVHRLMSKFNARAPGDLQALQQAIRSNDFEKAEKLAHGMRGAAGYVAADNVRRITAQIESLMRKGDLCGTADLLSALAAELQRCADEALAADLKTTSENPRTAGIR